MRNGSLWSNVVFQKELNYHSIFKDYRAWSFFLDIWKHIFLSLISCSFDDQLISNFHTLLFYGYVEIHQVRILVYDNYQRCPMPVRKILSKQKHLYNKEGKFFLTSIPEFIHCRVYCPPSSLYSDDQLCPCLIWWHFWLSWLPRKQNRHWLRGTHWKRQKIILATHVKRTFSQKLQHLS